jgi:hypothetical protein
MLKKTTFAPKIIMASTSSAKASCCHVFFIARPLFPLFDVIPMSDPGNTKRSSGGGRYSKRVGGGKQGYQMIVVTDSLSYLFGRKMCDLLINAQHNEKYTRVLLTRYSNPV